MLYTTYPSPPRSRFRLVFRGLAFTHGPAVELGAVGVVDKAVEDGVCECWIADHHVPLVERPFPASLLSYGTNVVNS